MNLIPILKTFPIDTPLYSMVHGDCVFKGIERGSTLIRIAFKQLSGVTFSALLTAEGKLYDMNRDARKGECILFSSRTQRDWTKVKIHIEEGTPVMVSRDSFDWTLAKYSSNNIDKNYIVPVSVFNFEFPQSEPLLNYGLLNP